MLTDGDYQSKQSTLDLEMICLFNVREFVLWCPPPEFFSEHSADPEKVNNHFSIKTHEPKNSASKFNLVGWDVNHVSDRGHVGIVFFKFKLFGALRRWQVRA